jgi:hypothetical protein
MNAGYVYCFYGDIHFGAPEMKQPVLEELKVLKFLFSMFESCERSKAAKGEATPC